MTRYTINIGDDFPLGGDEASGRHDPGEAGQRHRRRHGLFLRVLFFLAVAAIVISHPLQTLLVVGVVLLIRRSPWFADARARWRARWQESWREGWRGGQWRSDAWSAWQRGCRGRGTGRRRDEQHTGEQTERGYRGFV